MLRDVNKRVGQAVKHFWLTREKQAHAQGAVSGRKDRGARAAVTGGKHMDGFVQLCRDILLDAGLAEAEVFWNRKLELPGYFRPEKRWDLLAVAEGKLLAVIEFKAQVGPSFGNNFNNRAEEALGIATDLWTAYREGAFADSPRPWLGFVFLLEDCPGSRTPVGVKEPHFPGLPGFRDASYAKRYELLLARLLRERLYDGVSLLLSEPSKGKRGSFSSPSQELDFTTFAARLWAHVAAFANAHRNNGGAS